MTDVPNEVPDSDPTEAPTGPGPDLPLTQPGEDPGVMDDAPEGAAVAGGDAPI